MTESVTNVSLSEMTIVRVKCKKCKAVSELPIEDLAKRFRSQDCPHCSEAMWNHGKKPLAELWLAFKACLECSDDIEVVFPIKTTEEK